MCMVEETIFYSSQYFASQRHVFGWLAAGKIGAGSYVAGTKHVVAMIVIAVIAFNLPM